jgi:hypothetical protein
MRQRMCGQASMQSGWNAPGANSHSICGCLAASRPKDRLFRSYRRHTRTCSSIRRTKRAMSSKWVAQHLCCCPHQRASFQTTLLLCLEHSFMPSRLKGCVPGPPSVHDAMAPTPCSFLLQRLFVPQHVPLSTLLMRTSYSQGVCCSVSPYYNSLSCLLLVGR